MNQVVVLKQARKTTKTRSSTASDCAQCLKNDVISKEANTWPLKRLPIHLIDQNPGTELYDEVEDEDFDELSDYSEEVAMILNLDFLGQAEDALQQQDDDSHYSVTEDSLEVARRRSAKKKESRMKPLSDFRRSFARCILNSPSDIDRSRNTTSPPCA